MHVLYLCRLAACKENTIRGARPRRSAVRFRLATRPVRGLATATHTQASSHSRSRPYSAQPDPDACGRTHHSLGPAASRLCVPPRALPKHHRVLTSVLVHLSAHESASATAISSFCTQHRTPPEATTTQVKRGTPGVAAETDRGEALCTGVQRGQL